ncbi:ribonuclease H-like domain-containing protein [Cristinia sonorae]|uniref:Ribonuclease H-like domain-containing protein n=1 Tax=Cristinia sonorae TaxID=1940300 RepID=A0A8K0UQS8_9AGAR|nr:ribonuclease H-like domain-containing protein [Cristinia sonorae]
MATTVAAVPKPAPLEVKYTFVQNYNQLPKVISRLSSSSHILIDCEGQNIGTPTGILSLISVGTADSKDIFVIDVLRVRDRTHPQVQRFLRLLEDPSVLKVIWDGRMDHVEIFMTFGVKIRGVLDLQVVEVMSREGVRGERDYQRRGRFRKMFGNGALKDSTLRPLMRDFHAVTGLQGIVNQEKIVMNLAKDAEVVAMHKDGNSSFWLTRPLPSNLLKYAAADIKLVGLTYDHFVQHKWITAETFPRLLAQSTRYLQRYTSRGDREETEGLGSMRIIPLDVVYDTEQKQYECQLCLHMLNLCCFETLRIPSAPPNNRRPQPSPPHGPGFRDGQGQKGRGRTAVRQDAALNETRRSSCCRVCVVCAKVKGVDIDVGWVVV